MDRFGEPVAYDATAVRPSYGSLPAPVSERIAKELGGEPAAVEIAGGGFTGGFAARLRSGSGAELFVKAVGPDKPNVAGPYRREALNHTALPEAVPAPRLQFSAEVEDWIVLGFEAVPGRAVSLPMTPETVSHLLRAWAVAAAALTPAPQALLDIGIKSHSVDYLLNFTAVASGQTEPFWLPPALSGRIDEIAAIESKVEEAMRADAIQHGDLRPDNMIIGDGRAWACDWTDLSANAAWFDTVALLTVAHGDGHDAEALFWDHPTSSGVTDEQLDAVLAGITGYYLKQAPGGLIDGVSPHIRKHQRWNGFTTADWLANRRGW